MKNLSTFMLLVLVLLYAGQATAQTQVTNLDETTGYYFSSTAGTVWSYGTAWNNPNTIVDLAKKTDNARKQVWKFTKQADDSYKITTVDGGIQLAFASPDGAAWGVVSGSETYNVYDAGSSKYILKRASDLYPIIFSSSVSNRYKIGESSDTPIEFTMEAITPMSVPGYVVRVTDVDETQGYYFSSTAGKVWTYRYLTTEPDPTTITDGDKNITDGTKQVWEFEKQADDSYKITTADGLFQLSYTTNDQYWGVVAGTDTYYLYKKPSADEYMLERASDARPIEHSLSATHRYGIADAGVIPIGFTMEAIAFNAVPGLCRNMIQVTDLNETYQYYMSAVADKVLTYNTSGAEQYCVIDDVKDTDDKSCQLWKFEKQADNSYKITTNNGTIQFAYTGENAKYGCVEGTDTYKLYTVNDGSRYILIRASDNSTFMQNIYQWAAPRYGVRDALTPAVAFSLEADGLILNINSETAEKDFRVTSGNGYLTVKTEVDATIRITDMLGNTLYKGLMQPSEKSVFLNNGIYVVIINDNAVKVVVE